MVRSNAARSAQNNATIESTTPPSNSDSSSAPQVADQEHVGEQSASNVPRHVNSLSELYAATKWMAEEATKSGPRHVFPKCVKHFPSYFTGTAKAKLQKASRWWKMRESTLALKTDKKKSGAFLVESTRRHKRVHLKSLPGRGLKRDM